MSKLTYHTHTTVAKVVEGYKVIPMFTVPAPTESSWGLKDLLKAVRLKSLTGQVVEITRNKSGIPLYAEFTQDGMVNLGLSLTPVGIPSPMCCMAKVIMHPYGTRNVRHMLGIERFSSWGCFGKLLEIAKQCEPDPLKRLGMADGGNKFVYVLEDYAGKTLCLKFHDHNLFISTELET